MDKMSNTTKIVDFKNKKDRLDKAGTSAEQSIPLSAKASGLDDVSLMKKYYDDNPEQKVPDKSTKFAIGNFVTIKGDNNKQFEVININSKGDVDLRDTDTNAVISKSKQDLLPINTEKNMNKINEAQYSVSINGLETQDAETLSQMFSLAAQAEQPEVAPEMGMPVMNSEFDDPELNADAEMGDMEGMPDNAVEPEMDMPTEEPTVEVSDIPASEEIVEGCSKEKVKEETEAEEVLEKPEEEVKVEEIDEEVSKYLDEVGCCCGKKKVKEADDFDYEELDDASMENGENVDITDEEKEEVESIMKGFDENDTAEEITDQLRSLNSEGVINDNQYNYAINHMDEILDDTDNADETENSDIELSTPEVPEENGEIKLLNEEEPVDDAENEVSDDSSFKKFKVTGIQWETDGEEEDLPEELVVEIEVPEGASEEEITDKISDEITNQTGWLHNGFKYEPVEETEENIDEAVNEFLRNAGIKLDEAEVENAKPEIVNDETLIANKKDSLGTEAGEEQRPEYQEIKGENTWGKDSSKGMPSCPFKLKEMVDMDKIKSICETANKMYKKYDKEDWLFLDRRYIGKLMQEGVSYSNASKMLIIAKK